MSMKHFAALSCALAALAAAGCGKSGKPTAATNSSSTTTTAAATSPQPVAPVYTKAVADPTSPPESRSQYDAKINKICLALDAKRKTKMATVQEVVETAKTLTAYERSVTIPAMEKLSPPRSLVSDWRKMVELASTLPVYAQRIGEAVHASGQLTTATVQSLSKAHLSAELKALNIAIKDHLIPGFYGCQHQI